MSFDETNVHMRIFWHPHTVGRDVRGPSPSIPSRRVDKDEKNRRTSIGRGNSRNKSEVLRVNLRSLRRKKGNVFPVVTSCSPVHRSLITPRSWGFPTKGWLRDPGICLPKGLPGRDTDPLPLWVLTNLRSLLLRRQLNTKLSVFIRFVTKRTLNMFTELTVELIY